MMKKRHKIILWLGFIVYGLVLFALLTFYRLPAEKILTKAVESATGGKVFVSSKKVSASLWNGYRFEDLTWTVQSGSGVVSDRMESLTLSPGYLGLLRGYLPVEIEGAVAKGTFQVSAGVSVIRGLGKGYARFKALGINLGDLATVNQTAQREIKGKLTAIADFYGPLDELRKLNGQGSILIEDGSVDTRVDAFGLRTIPFETLSLPLTVRNGVAGIKDGRLVGPVFTGSLEGQIRLLQNLQASPIQITASMRPGPSLKGGGGGNLPLPGNTPVIIRLEGTIGKPLFTLAGG